MTIEYTNKKKHQVSPDSTLLGDDTSTKDRDGDNSAIPAPNRKSYLFNLANQKIIPSAKPTGMHHEVPTLAEIKGTREQRLAYINEKAHEWNKLKTQAEQVILNDGNGSRDSRGSHKSSQSSADLINNAV
jgi:hypothetical protein